MGDYSTQLIQRFAHFDKPPFRYSPDGYQYTLDIFQAIVNKLEWTTPEFDPGNFGFNMIALDRIYFPY